MLPHNKALTTKAVSMATRPMTDNIGKKKMNKDMDMKRRRQNIQAVIDEVLLLLSQDDDL